MKELLVAFALICYCISVVQSCEKESIPIVNKRIKPEDRLCYGLFDLVGVVLQMFYYRFQELFAAFIFEAVL